MERTRRELERKKRHARSLAQYAVGEAGTPTQVGHALGVAPSTVAHYASDRVHPALRDAFLVLMNFAQHPGVDPEAFVQACDDAVEFGSVVMRETDDLVRDGFQLLDLENEHGCEEDRASLRGVDHEIWLLRHSRTQVKLSRTIRELRLRGVDLHQLYRERVA